MRYIDVVWKHENPSYPIRLVSEVDDGGYEKRKLEYFPDGRVGFAAATRTRHGTALSIEPLPPLDQINEDPQFRGAPIDELEFERQWKEHVRT